MSKILLFLTLIIMPFSSKNLSTKEGVILLHELYRSSKSMNKMAKALQQHGYLVSNVSHPSRISKIKELADQAIAKAISSEEVTTCSKIHFVTHSMGGILVRSYFQDKEDHNLGRVVMLAPPNQGSEVVDKINSWRILHWINGSARKELSTKPNSTPNQLGAVTFECGILTGDRSINWINSLMIPGKGTFLPNGSPELK